MEENIRIQPLQPFSKLLEQITPTDARVERPIPKAEVRKQEENSMAALKAMMGNVQNSPLKRKPRKTR